MDLEGDASLGGELRPGLRSCWDVSLQAYGWDLAYLFPEGQHYSPQPPAALEHLSVSVWSPLNRHCNYTGPHPDLVTSSPNCPVSCRNPAAVECSFPDKGWGRTACPHSPWYLGHHSDEVSPVLLIVQGASCAEVQHAAVAIHSELGGQYVL